MADESSSVVDRLEKVTIHRRPKYSVFLLLGAALGVFTAMLLTFAFGSFEDGREVSVTTVSYSQGQVFGFLLLACAPGGAVLGAFIALLLDATVGRRARSAAVDHARILIADDE